MKTKQDKYAIAPFLSEKLGDKFLVSNYFGSWDILTKKEFDRFSSFKIDNKEFIGRLYDKGLVIDEKNVPRLINEYRRFNSHLFSGPSLQIVVVTTNCNLSCRYCQTSQSEKQTMDKNTASKILDFISGIEEKAIQLEFQGGEPLLNWPVIEFFTKNVSRLREKGKRVRISLVTNGLLLDKDKLKFLVDNEIDICSSLDGPKVVHDKNRVFSNGNGSYDKTVKALRMIRKFYKENKVQRNMDLLPTVTKVSLKYPKQIIDEYIKWGVKVIPLRPLTKLGSAQKAWREIGYTPEEFNRFWKKSMDYLLEYNKKGKIVAERLSWVLLKKILKKEDPGYVDLMSPCGTGRKVLTYMPNGDIYPCDEARMAGEEMFKLGNIKEGATYHDIVKDSSLLSLSCSSIINLWDYDSAFSPWMGTCPVVNYMQQNNLVPKIVDTPLYKIYRFQLKYLFAKMAESNIYKDIFTKWVS